MTARPSNIVAIAMAASGVVLFSAKAVMVKLAYRYGIDAVSVLLLRMVFSLPVYIVIGLVWGKKPEGSVLRPRDYAGVLVAGVVGYYLASLFDFMGLEYITASLERLILFTYPTIVVLMSRFILKEAITREQYIGIVVTYLGMLVIFSEQLFLDTQKDFWLGAGLILLSAITYAYYLVSSGRYIPRFGTIRFTSMALSISAFCTMIHFYVGDFPPISGHPYPVYWIGLAMAIFATVIPSFMISGAIKRIGAPGMALIASLGPVSTVVLAMIFLGETLSIGQVVGSAIVIGGVIWVNRKKS